MKRLYFLLLAAVFFSSNSVAQKTSINKISLTGYVIDSLSGKNIEYPTISIFTDSLKMIKSVVGGADGKFFIDAPGKGKYTIYVSMMGYKNAKKRIDLDGVSSKVELGKVYIQEGVQLAEVRVVGVKPLIKNEPDKLTYNIDSDPMAASSSLVDIMRKVPMLSVDGEGNVKMNGESNYKVLLNGRSSGLIVKNFKEVIKAMPANSIKSIEVITNPPIKYDAEGISGIINIITNRKNPAGYNGNLSIGANTLNGYNLGGFFSAQVGKLALSTNIYNGTEKSNKNTIRTLTENLISDTYKYSTSEGSFNSNNNFTMFGVEASYEIDSLNLITLNSSGFLASSRNNSYALNTIRSVSNTLTRSYSQIRDGLYSYDSGSGSLSYQKTFKKPDQNLTVSYSLDINPVSQDVMSMIESKVNFIDAQQHSSNEAYSADHTFQVDYYDPIFKNHQIETGAKYILRQSVSTTQVEMFDMNSNSWVNEPSKVNDLDFDQHIGNLYGGYVFKRKSMTAKAGLRVEYTFNDGLSKNPDGNLEFTNRQFNVIPYINLMWTLKKGNTLSLSYTKRLNRPGIMYLNPYVDNIDPMNINTGNPDLKSVKRDTYTISYRKSSQRWNLGLNLNGGFTKNNIERVSFVDNLGVKKSTYENIGVSNRIGLGVNYSYRYNTAFSINTNFAVNYVAVSTPNSMQKNDGVNVNGGLNSTFALWKKAELSMGIFMYNGEVSLQTSSPVFFFTNFGLSQRLFKDKLTISMSVSEPFKKLTKFSFDSKDATYITSAERSVYQRSASFSLSWRFGKFNTNVKKARKSGVDDKMGGNQPSGPGKM